VSAVGVEARGASVFAVRDESTTLALECLWTIAGRAVKAVVPTRQAQSTKRRIARLEALDLAVSLMEGLVCN
jgi:hypothetical protein